MENEKYWNKLLAIYHKFNDDGSLAKSVEWQMSMGIQPKKDHPSYLKWKRNAFLMALQKVLGRMDCVHFVYGRPFEPIDVWIDGEIPPKTVEKKND